MFFGLIVLLILDSKLGFSKLHYYFIFQVLLNFVTIIKKIYKKVRKL
jgi:hypothetical protein